MTDFAKVFSLERNGHGNNVVAEYFLVNKAINYSEKLLNCSNINLFIGTISV